MEKDFKKDLIILNLLIGWEIIHLSKRGKSVAIRLREFPEEPNRFIKINFSKCELAIIIDINEDKQFEDFSIFNWRACTLSKVKMEPDGILSIFLVGEDGKLGIMKFLAGDILFEFKTK